MENNNEKVKNKKRVLLISCIILLVVVLIGGLFYYKLSKPKNIIITQINKSIDNVKSKQIENKDMYNSTIKYSGKIETQNEEIKKIAEYINDSELYINTQLNKKAKKMSMAMKIDYKNENFFDGSLYYQVGDETFYVYIKELFNKYLKVDLQESLNEESRDALKTFLSDNSNYLDENNLLNKIKENIKREIDEKFDEDYFSKENVNGMTKNTLKMKVVDVKDVALNTVQDLMNDKEFLKEFEDPDSIKAELEDLSGKLMQDTKYDDYSIEFSIYTEGIFNKEVKKTELSIIASETESGTLTLNKIDNNNIEFSLNINTVQNGMNITAEALKGKINKEEIDSETEKYTIVIDNIPDVGKITLNMEINNKNETTFDEFDLSNSVYIKDLTEEDKTKLLTNFMNSNLYKVISPMFGI